MEEQVIIEFIPDTTQLDKTLNEISKGITDELGKAGGGKDFLKGVAQGIAEETKEVEKLKKSVDNLTKSEVAANKEIDKFAKSMNQLSQGIAGGAIKQGTDNITKIGNAATKTAGETTKLTTQLRALREQLGRLDEGSAEFQRISIEAAKLEDRIGDVSQRIRALSSDTFAIDAVVDSARAVAGAFSIAQGAAALFGDENQDLQKALLKVQGSLAVLNGLQEVSNFVTGQSAGKLAILAAAQRVYAFVTNASTFATRAFTLALSATVIGGAIIALGLLVAKMFDYEEATVKATDKQDDLNKSLKEFNTLTGETDILLRKYGLQAKQVNDVLASLSKNQKIAAFSTDLLKGALSSLQEDIEKRTIEDFALTFVGDTTTASERFEQFRKLTLAQIDKLNAEIKKRSDELNKEALFAKGSIKDLEQRIAKINEQIKVTNPNSLLFAQLTEQANKLNFELENIKKQFDDIILKIDAFQQDAPELTPKGLIDISPTAGLKDAVTRERERQDAIREAAIEGTQQTFDAINQIAANNRATQLAEDLAALDRKRQAELSNTELTDAQRLAIDKKYAQQQAQLRLKAFNAEKQAKIAAAFINGALAITNILATVPPVIPGTIIPNPQYAASLALAGITTALQVATIAAQKPPAFKKGTKGAKQSAMSLVGEEGAELMYVPQGAKIVPHSETMKVLSGHPDTNEILSRFNIPVSSPKINTLKKEFNGYDFSRLEKAISKNNARFPQVNMDKNGIVTIVNEENSSRTYYGQRYSSR